MYVLIKGRKYKVYEENRKFYIQKRKTYRKYVKGKDVIMSPVQKRKEIKTDISALLREDEILRGKFKSLEKLLTEKEKQINELKSEFKEEDIKKFVDECDDAKKLLQSDIDNLKSKNAKDILEIVNVWISAGFIPIEKSREIEENLRNGNGPEYVKILLQDIFAKVNQKQQEAESELKELNEQLLLTEAEIEKLYATGNECGQKLQEKETELGNLTKDLALARGTISENENKIQEQIIAIRELGQKMDEAMSNCENVIHQKEVQISVLEEKLSNKDSECDEKVKRAYLENNEEISQQFLKEIDEYKSQLEIMREELAEKKDVREKFQEFMVNYQALLSTIQDEYIPLLENNRAKEILLQDEINKLIQENGRVVQNKNTLESDLLANIDSLKNKIEECLQQTETLERDKKDLLENNEIIESQIQEHVEQINSLIPVISQLQTENAQLKQKMHDDLEEFKMTINYDKNICKDEKNILNGKISVLESAFTELKSSCESDIESYKQMIDTFEERQTNCELGKGALQEAIQEIESDNTRLKNDNNKLRRELEFLQSDFIESKNEIRKLINKVRELEDENVKMSKIINLTKKH